MTPIAPSVIDQVSASMSATSLRHQVIAANIANHDTPGYQRMKLQFDRAMGTAGESASVAADTSALSVSLEQDLVALSSNATQYQALARVLNRYFSIVSTITTQGRA